MTRRQVVVGLIVVLAIPGGVAGYYLSRGVSLEEIPQRALSDAQGLARAAEEAVQKSAGQPSSSTPSTAQEGPPSPPPGFLGIGESHRNLEEFVAATRKGWPKEPRWEKDEFETIAQFKQRLRSEVDQYAAEVSRHAAVNALCAVPFEVAFPKYDAQRSIFPIKFYLPDVLPRIEFTTMPNDMTLKKVINNRMVELSARVAPDRAREWAARAKKSKFQPVVLVESEVAGYETREDIRRTSVGEYPFQKLLGVKLKVRQVRFYLDSIQPEHVWHG